MVKRNQNDNAQSKGAPTALVNAQNHLLQTVTVEWSSRKDVIPVSDVINEGYKLVITEGYVSAEGDANQQPVKIMRHRGISVFVAGEHFAAI